MNIATASIYAKQGYKITRAAWKLRADYLCDFEGCGVHFKDGLLMGGDTYFMLIADDLLADDWEVVT